MQRLANFVMVSVAAVLAWGCEGPDRPAWLSVNPNKWANRNLPDDPRELRVIGAVEVDVDNFNGDVIIEGNRLLPKAIVQVSREAVHGYERIGEGLDSLREINYTTRVVAGDMGQRLEIRCRSFHPEAHYQRAHMYIQVPDIENVKVRTTNGRVWVSNFRGKADVTTSYGEVKLMTNQTLNQPVTVVNRNGDIEVRVRGESQGRIDAETINGKAHAFARYGRLLIGDGTTNDVFHGTLNGGTNPITLRTVNGDVYFAAVYDPELDEGRMFD